MRLTRRAFGVLTAAALCAPNTATGAARAVTLEDVLRECTEVFVGTVKAFARGAPGDDGAAPISRTTFEVEKSLRGSVPRGGREIESPPGASPNVRLGERCVVFVDRARHFRWAARPITGSLLERAILEVRGFGDDAEHAVTPSLLTLTQLSSALLGGKPSYRLRGPLWLPRAGSPPAPSSIRLVVTRDLGRGLGALDGLGAAGPPAAVEIGGEEHVRVLFARNLEIGGEVTALDEKTGDYEARFWLVRPGALVQSELDAYLADPKLSRVERTILIQPDGGPAYQWLRGAPGTARGGVLVAPDGSRHPCTSLQAGEVRFEGGVVLAPDPDPDWAIGWPGGDRLVLRLLVGPVPGRVRVGGRARPCSISLAASRLVGS